MLTKAPSMASRGGARPSAAAAMRSVSAEVVSGESLRQFGHGPSFDEVARAA
ncbi:MAG: hypothetical protein IPK28_10585 [Devosia sp.]|nr:hypothetical protein [Devosia sp.]